MQAIEGGWQHTANAVIHRLLPPVCQRPTSLFDLPALLLSDSQCFRASLSLAIGAAIVLFAGLIKLPQILTIVSSKSVEGLSATTFLVETFGYTYNLAAHYREGYPLSTYGEFSVLLLQDYVILYLLYRYTGRSQFGVAVVLSFIVSLLVFCSHLFPIQLLELMTLGNVAVVILSRTPQVYANFVNASTGALSAFTCWGLFLGACARVFTTLQDVDSLNILAGYLISALLNGIIAFQVVYYKYLKKTDAKLKKT